MRTMILSALLVLLLAAACQALSPKLEEMRRYHEEKVAVLPSLDAKERAVVETVGAFLAEAEQGRISARFAASAPQARAYSDQVALENEHQFHLRQMTKIDAEDLLVSFLNSRCVIPCGSLLGGIIESLLPDVIILQSLNAEGETSGTDGSAVLDLLMHLLTFPGSSSTLNTLLDQVLGISLYPSTAVAYFTANAQFDLSFDGASADLTAQAFALLQTYSRVIEYQDTNGNKRYDEGEERTVVNLASAGWNPTTYVSQAAGSSGMTVHSVSASTEDGVVAFNCDTSTFPVKDSFNQIISPNATKCTITIEGFSFTTQQSLLAIEVYAGLYGATFRGAADAQITDFALHVDPNPSTGVQGGQFSWVPSVDVNGQNFAVIARGSAAASDGLVDLAATLALSGTGSTSSDARKVIFSFVTGPNPSKVVWDPSVTYGEPPVEAASSAASLLPGSLLLVLAVSLLSFFC